MTKEEREKIERRITSFLSETKTRKGVQTVLITTLGCEMNRNADVCQRYLTLDDLFVLSSFHPKPLKNQTFWIKTGFV